MVVIRIFSCIFLLLSVPALSAQLLLTVTNQHGEVIPNAVAALVPTQATDFTAVPPAIMDQRDNMFVPGVLAIRVNTLVRFPNSDDVRHHVYSFSPAKKFELRLYHGMTAEPVLFDQPGTVVLGCNIHDSMVAYIYVVETNFFAQSDQQGNIQLNAPAGEYQLQMYHPQMREDFPESRIVLGDSTKQQVIVLNNLSPPTATEPTDEFSDLF
ncbi:methylamine utilization protein [Cellvibrio sp. OA-2007]|uniref:methylamine utilization protein n=1 Tax=Cellvibrio sp. OA-2007 TaxID=529823 RepID=UPI0007807113|nr:methylamine utilization protein [Cellvibrio sp. OA-2007]